MNNSILMWMNHFVFFILYDFLTVTNSATRSLFASYRSKGPSSYNNNNYELYIHSMLAKYSAGAKNKGTTPTPQWTAKECERWNASFFVSRRVCRLITLSKEEFLEEDFQWRMKLKKDPNILRWRIGGDISDQSHKKHSNGRFTLINI